MVLYYWALRSDASFFFLFLYHDTHKTMLDTVGIISARFMIQGEPEPPEAQKGT